MIRVAAVGDLHVGEDSRGTLRSAFRELPECADVLLLAGDLTRLPGDGIRIATTVTPARHHAVHEVERAM